MKQQNPQLPNEGANQPIKPLNNEAEADAIVSHVEQTITGINSALADSLLSTQKLQIEEYIEEIHSNLKELELNINYTCGEDFVK